MATYSERWQLPGSISRHSIHTIKLPGVIAEDEARMGVSSLTCRLGFGWAGIFWEKIAA